MKQVINIRYAGTYYVDKFAKEIRLPKETARRINYPLSDKSLTEHVFQGLRGHTTLVRIVVNMISSQKQIGDVLNMLQEDYQT